MKTLKLIVAVAALLIAGTLSAQETGIIKGTITDSKGTNIPFVSVALFEDSTFITGMITDDNGDFTFKLLTPITYNVRLTSLGYNTKWISKVEVSANKTSYIYKSMESATNTLGPVVITTDAWEKPAIDPTFTTMTIIDINQIEDIAESKSDLIGIIVSVTPGILPTDDGKDIYLRGSRRGSTAYYIDGNRVIGNEAVPGNGIGGISVITGGVPAEFGDCTGGLVIVNTKDYKVESRRKERARDASDE